MSGDIDSRASDVMDAEIDAPGANDNASGVAAVLGCIRVLAALSTARPADACRATIRCLWGPEFLGTAATLHDCFRTTGGARPRAVINLDMVGENQTVCGGPFIVERPAGLAPSLLGPVAEAVVERVFAVTAEHPGRWAASPLLGFSDHALFADPRIGCPAVQFCHTPDRFNHSAADTIDKVCAVELRRTIAAASLLGDLLAHGGPDPETARQITLRWCDTELRAVEAIARNGSGVDPAWAARLIEAERERAAALTSLIGKR